MDYSIGVPLPERCGGSVFGLGRYVRMLLPSPLFRLVIVSLFPGLFLGHDPTRGPDQEVSKLSRVESDRVRRSYGLGWIGSGRVGVTRPDPAREI